MPAYQDYISKSQVTRVVGELAAAKTAVDAALFDGKLPGFKDTAATNTSRARENIGLTATDVEKTSASNARSNLIAKIAINGFNKDNLSSGDITATLGGNANSNIHGATIAQARDANGVWTCHVLGGTASSWKSKFVPSGCSETAATAPKTSNTSQSNTSQ